MPRAVAIWGRALDPALMKLIMEIAPSLNGKMVKAMPRKPRHPLLAADESHTVDSSHNRRSLVLTEPNMYFHLTI